MANMIFPSASQESNELTHQFATDAGGGLFPLAPHKVHMQEKGSSDDVEMDMMNVTAELQMEFAIISVIEYFNVSAATADPEPLL